jgi:hypothetical protein
MQLPGKMFGGWSMDSRLGFVVVALFGLSITGCGSGLSTVTGTVTYKGEPCKGAFIVFHPVNPASEKAIRPYGTVGDDGKFQLTSDPQIPNGGALPGEYIVAIIWNAPAKKPNPNQGMGGEGENKTQETDLLNGKYRDEKVSSIRRTVKPGSNTLEPITLD